MARIPFSYSLFGFMVLLVVLSASQLSIADYVYCAKQGDAFCPGKECESIFFAPSLSHWDCTTCAYRCQSTYHDAFRGSFCYISPNGVFGAGEPHCLCCFHSLADEEIYMPPTMSPMGTPIPAPVQPPPYVEPSVAPPQPPPVFTVNQDPAVYCYDGYPVTTPVGDCSECNERCRLGSFQQYGLPGAFFQYGLAGVFCYTTRQGKPFCNCCVYGDSM
ncbi:hypothetical protein MKW98_000072 [Papaver atlanticum]|uniref:Uncharacterized protein n=1 Tax=Papaver atlanticum TaxID=357466 RepID=A0AAD4SAN8_9MAGN|nr:hypothetical protein MKW98_000072 [Papaver atlanticum]